MSQQPLQKTYQCLTCKADIKLARKDDNSGWDKFNLDGTPHIHPSNKKNQQGAQLAALAQEVSELRAEVKILITQITMLRGELKKH
jgi:hypothetical protein